MQQVLRPYATAGIALVGASMIAVTPVVAPLPEIQTHSVKLVDAWSDLLTDTTANLANISANTDLTAITGVFQALLSNPLGVFQALTDLTPTVTGSLPGGLNVDLPPGLEVLLAQIGAEAAALNAVNDVVAQLATNPSGAFNTLLEAPAVIANAFLNGEDNISLLGGLVNIAGFNGILAPLQDVSINLNLSSLIDALGLGNIDLSSLDLSTLLNITNLGGLIDALQLGETTLSSLIGNVSLGTLLENFGLGELALPGISLTSVLDAFGLDFGTLDLTSVLDAFGLNTSIPLLGDSLGDVLSDTGLLSTVTTALSTTITGIVNTPVISLLLGNLLSPLLEELTDPDNVLDALNNVSVGELLGIPGGGDTVTDLLAALGVNLPTTLNVADILTDLGFPSTIGGLDLGGLLDGLDLDTIGLGTVLDGVSVGNLLSDLGLSGLPLDLSDLTGGLNLGDLLSSLDLGNIGLIDIDGFGGLITQLVDTIPQQILAALSG